MNVSLHVDPYIIAKHGELIETPVVVRVNDFTESGARDFEESLTQSHNTGQPVIPIVIDSYGGEVYSLLDMVSQIQGCRLPVVTVCEGKAMSCGAVLFTMGKQRWISRTGTLMIHDLSSGELGKVEELKASTEEAERLNKMIYRLMAKNCGQPADYFMDIIHEKGHAEWYLTSTMARRHKVATHLGTPSLTAEVKIHYSMTGWEK